MSQKNDILRVARGELGVKESPRNSNRVKYTAWYGMVGPWCAMFISWIANRAGIPTSIIPKHAYTPSGAAWFRKRNQWSSKPRVGDIVYYNISGLRRISHVGIVETVHKDGSWTAIEGNTDAAGGRTGGQVMRKRRRTVGAGGGFGRPAYDGKPSVPASTGNSADGYRTVSHGTVLRRGVQGPPVREWQQKALGYTGADLDGKFGPGTERDTIAFQKRHGVHADGVVGPLTWPLRNRGKATPASKPKPAKAPGWKNLAVDGALGRLTIEALQAAIGTKVDGKLGRASIRALQKKLGLSKVQQDGVLGPITVRALQRKVSMKGKAVDGKWGPATTRKLQTHLNYWKGKL